MSTAQLVKMANDIADFFAAEPDCEAAVHGVYDHINRFWAPRMREQIIAHLHAGGEGLSELAMAAMQKLAAEREHQAS